ncbi:MAG: ThiF family adenylyltransferase [Eubacterium sp.]|nr:ThiF family adenylyltransferase [Eubacterium sp.]
MSLKSDIQGFDISKNSAVIIGCGGLGTNVAVHLAGAGAGKLLLVDYDTVEQRNLNRQFFYTKKDIKKEKCALLAERLSAYSPETEIKYYSGKYDKSLINGYDIVIIAVDNIETRKAVNSDCKKSKIPCVNGSINGFYGFAYLYIPDKTPDLEEAGCLNKPDGKMKSPSATAAIIGALEAQLVTDFFLGKTESAGKLYIYDNNEIHSLKIRSDKND